jgi:hypothetical protein
MRHGDEVGGGQAGFELMMLHMMTVCYMRKTPDTRQNGWGGALTG